MRRCSALAMREDRSASGRHVHWPSCPLGLALIVSAPHPPCWPRSRIRRGSCTSVVRSVAAFGRSPRTTRMGRNAGLL